MNQISKIAVTVNRRAYPWPLVPAIAICLDGCEPAYLDEAIKAGLMPTLKRIKGRAPSDSALSVIPSFTNPNNMSIATGRPPAVHGICGNYLYEPQTGKEVMMNDPQLPARADHLQSLHDAGAKVADRHCQGQTEGAARQGPCHIDDSRAICFSSEKSDKSTTGHKRDRQRVAAARHPGPRGLLSRAFGIRVRRRRQAAEGISARCRRISTTTDYVQHKYAPGVPEANAFYKMFDKLPRRNWMHSARQSW